MNPRKRKLDFVHGGTSSHHDLPGMEASSRAIRIAYSTQEKKSESPSKSICQCVSPVTTWRRQKLRACLNNYEYDNIFSHLSRNRFEF